MDLVKRHLRRLRETNAASAQPQMMRAGFDDEAKFYERDFSDDDRERLAKSGAALPDGSFPIETQTDLANAVDAYGRAGDKPAAKAHIVKRARALGATAKLPDGWATKAKESEAKHAHLSTITTLREAVKTDDDGYEVTVVREGLGNASDRNWYTPQALREAVAGGMFDGLKSFGNHPTTREQRELPERSIWDIAGYYHSPRFVEAAGRGEVRAVFVPVERSDRDVRGLVESAIRAQKHTDKPLIGISIDGDGTVEAGTHPTDGDVNFVRTIESLHSADLVTEAGAGGGFRSGLRESLRGLARPDRHHHQGEQVTMKLTELQEKARAAEQLFQTAIAEAQKEDGDEDAMKRQIADGFSALREVAQATVEPEVREVEKPVAASDDDKDQLAATLAEAQTKLTEAERRAKEAEGKVSQYDRAATAARVLKEAEVGREDAERWLPDLAALDTEEHMKRLVEGRKAEREAILSQVRESFQGVSGHGPRTPAPATGGSRDPFEDAGIDDDEIESAD